MQTVYLAWVEVKYEGQYNHIVATSETRAMDAIAPAAATMSRSNAKYILPLRWQREGKAMVAHVDNEISAYVTAQELLT